MKTNIERVLDYLWSMSPDGATNAQIREATGIQPHQQVYMITSKLLRKRKIHSRRTGREWVFYIDETPEEILSSPAKFSIIAEHVWLLEKTQAKHKFLVFGNDIEVPRRLLARYGHLRGDTAFYFMTDEGNVIELN